MSQAYPLDSLIRRLDPASLPDRPEPDERVVIFDASKGETLRKKPFLTFGRDLRYFLVSTRLRRVEASGPICKVKSRTTGLSFEIAVSYEARCEPGNEERLVRALWRKEHPGAALDDLITRWIDEIALSPEMADRDLCLDFPTLEPKLRSLLTQRASQEAGFVLDVSLRPLIEDKLDKIRPAATFFPVRVRDSDEEIDIKVTTELEVDPDNRMRALLAYRQTTRLENVVRETVRHTLAMQVTLHELCYETKTRVRALLVAAINQRLYEEGRRISFLEIASPLFDKLPRDHWKLDHTATCDIRDHQGVKVVHRVQILLEDVGKLRASRIGDLEHWTRQRLERFTQEILFARSYIDLLLDFAPTEAEIKRRMEDALAGIGCAIEQLIAIPDLEPLSWKHGFQQDDNEKSYMTHDSRVEVRLNVVVKGKISNLRDERLNTYLRPQSRLFDDIREVIHRETQHIMHGIDPEQFYMRFQYTDRLGEQPVRLEIEERVRAALLERFAIEDISVIAKPLETDLTKRLGKLLEGPHMLEVACFPLQDSSRGEEVTYSVAFDIEGVHESGWHIFRAKSFPSFEAELQRISEVMAQDIRAKIELAPLAFRQFTDLGVQRKIEEVIHGSARRKVIEVFGLCVSVVTVTRKATAGEQVANQAMSHAREKSMETGRHLLESKTQELIVLTSKRLRLVEAGVEPDDPELQSIQDRIEALEREVAPDHRERGREEVKILLPEKSGSSGADWAQLALETPLHRRQLNAAAETDKP